MNSGRTVFAQLLEFVPFRHFEYLALKYGANHRSHGFSAWSHFVCMAYAQLTRRQGLRDLVACLNSQHARLYHCGVRQRLSRSTLADANERRHWQLFEALAQRMVQTATALHATNQVLPGLREPLYAMDSTTVDLCLQLFPWADFRSAKAAIKAHTVLDLRGAIPVMITITTGKVADVVLLDSLVLPAGSVVVLDRGYVDYGRLYGLVQRHCSFVVRAKSNLLFSCVYANEPDRGIGVFSDQVIELAASKSRRAYPQPLRRIRYYDKLNRVEFVFLTDRLDLPAMVIAQIYQQRWQIELFFKWLKQNLNIRHFFGNSENAVKSQIWIAICVYLAAVIARRTLSLPVSLHTFLHLLEVNLFEKAPLAQIVSNALEPQPAVHASLQDSLF